MKFVSDTHCLVWHFLDSSKLSSASKKLFADPTHSKQIVVPTIVLAELLHLSRKIALPYTIEETLRNIEKNENFEIYPLLISIIQKAVPLRILELHDALIVATALHLNIPLMTADEKIVASGQVETLRP